MASRAKKQTLLKTIWLGDIPIKVYLVEGLKNYGEWSPSKSKISIQAGLEERDRQSVLVHECIHAVSDTYGLDLTEQDVLTLERGLMQLTYPTNGDPL